MSAAAPFGVYVHWPYCASICPYCDFNVFRGRGGDDALLAAVLSDIAGWRERTGARRVTSIYLGGGTPSLLDPSDVGKLLDAVASAWDVDGDAEVTLEVNPEDASEKRFSGFRAAGVNRLSIGVQSLDDAALAALGRRHDAAQGRRAVALAMKAVPRVSLDLIYAREGQTLDAWADELGAALRLGAEHLSLYQLTIEPGTAFARQVERGRRTPIEEELAADFFEATAAITVATGCPAYEISNHATSEAARSRHNLLYWRSGEWAGIGPGAHGRLGASGMEGRRAIRAAGALDAYRARVAEMGWGAEEEELLDRRAQTVEFLLMGLRLEEGVTLERWTEVAGAPPSDDAVSPLIDDGLVEACNAAIRLTAAGRLAADRVAAQLAPD